jgi:D-erythronate 2-dehydrogenase
MKVLVTGAAGFLGGGVIRALLASGWAADGSGRHQPIDQIVAVDIVAPQVLDRRVSAHAADITRPEVLDALIDEDCGLVIHLAAVVSGQAEADFDLGMRVNFDATRGLLERLRALGHQPRLVMTSSVAVFGGDLPANVPDDHVWTPRSSYGTQKAMCDLLLSDYSRRGFVDGRSLRMPTISVRPGRPNAAASSFASGIIREPINGEDAVCPVAPDTVLWLMSPDKAVANILHGAGLDATDTRDNPVINMPGLSVTVREMLASLRRLCGDAVAERVRFAPDPAVQAIVNSWPGRFEADRGRRLGFVADQSFDDMIEAFLKTREYA